MKPRSATERVTGRATSLVLKLVVHPADGVSEPLLLAHPTWAEGGVTLIGSANESAAEAKSRRRADPMCSIASRGAARPRGAVGGTQTERGRILSRRADEYGCITVMSENACQIVSFTTAQMTQKRSSKTKKSRVSSHPEQARAPKKGSET